MDLAYLAICYLKSFKRNIYDCNIRRKAMFNDDRSNFVIYPSVLIL